MSTIGVVRDLAEVFLWIGLAGAGLALMCAIVVVVALAVGAPGVAGGAAAVWIGAAMLSLTSGFSGQWIPALVAAGGLVAALLLGAFARPVVRRFEARPKSEPVAAAAAPAAPTAPRRIGGVRTVGPESIR
ncbi:hypothetical protein [Microbacterium abyssi]|uniref:hypothetical protein n=1 Tax=Microbacterium abyssi TaxID=2782166 RepID=UPI00188910D0|nr:hypothetical protein [Microbacterium sp. A18JL241]